MGFASNITSRSAAIITGRRTAWIVMLVPILIAILAIGGVGKAEREAQSSDWLPRGADSTAAAALLDQLPAADTTAALIVWASDSGPLTEAQIVAVRAQAPDQQVTVSEDGTAALAVKLIDSGDADTVGEQVGDLRTQLSDNAPDGVSAQVTGPAGIQADLGAVFDGADLKLLLATMLIVAILLVITYRSPVLWLIPLIVVAIADQTAVLAATRMLEWVGLPWDGTTTGILSVLVFGAATDYALLLISRYRDELRIFEDRREAMAHALTRTAEAVLGSATTVFLTVLTLLLSLTPATRGLGLACAVGIVVAAFFALTVLPATLVLFGRWVFWPMVPRPGDVVASQRQTIFSRIGRMVARRPGTVIAGTVAMLAILASGTLGIKVGLDRADQFLAEPEAISAAARLAESFPAGTVEPTRIVTRADADDVLAIVTRTSGVDSARISAQGAGITSIDVVLADRPGTDGSADTIDRLQSRLAPLDAATHVGGSEAEGIDERAAAVRDLRLIVPIALAMVLIGLMVLLRAFLGPVLLVLSVVGTFVAALGASWWFFTGPLGFPAIDTKVPLFAFLFLVALGVDYNIFLVTRAREEAAKHGSREGMLRALTVTGGVITSAGFLLAAVFAVLGVLPLVGLAQLGSIICVGVLLDTLVVRTMLVPALGVKLGDRFWWPSRVDHRTDASDVPVEEFSAQH